MIGITSYGAYIPYHRLPRSVIGKAWGKPGGPGEKAVANFDEDSVTMAVAAGLDCLADSDNRSIDAFYLATTCSPYKERQNSIIVATALDLSREARTADFTNCLRSGTIALLAAIDTARAGSAKRILVAASDTRLGAASGENEQAFGDGAAALLIGDEKVIAEFEGSFTISEDFPDNWRSSEDVFVRTWEDRFGLEEGYYKFPVEAAYGAMKKCGLRPADFAGACYYGPNTRRHADLGKAMGFKPEQIQSPMLDAVGNTGSAQSVMTLAAALELASPGDRLLLVSYGNGSDALVFRVTPEIKNIGSKNSIKTNLANKKTLASYETYLRWRNLVPLEAAARPERKPPSVPSLWREHRTALPLYGSKCQKCGTPQLFLDVASTRARVCLNCQSKDDFEPYRFADKKGKLVSFSHDYLAPSHDPPSTIVVVDFDQGGRGSFEMTDRDPDECRVGLPVEMTFRKLFYERGIHNYFWKCRPVRS